MVILIGEEFAAKAQANRFAILSCFSVGADAALARSAPLRQRSPWASRRWPLHEGVVGGARAQEQRGEWSSRRCLAIHGPRKEPKWTKAMEPIFELLFFLRSALAGC